MGNTIRIEETAKRIIAEEVLCRADALVEYLLEADDLDGIQHIANRTYCRQCECVTSKCCDMDEDHEQEVVQVRAWYMIKPSLVHVLEKIGEVVYSLSDLEVYFWGRTCRNDMPLISDGTFQEVARIRIAKEERANE